MQCDAPGVASRPMSSQAQNFPGPVPEGGSFVDKIGMVIEEWTKERVVGTLPVEGNTQPYGFLHGGATCSLIESLASLGAAGVARPPRDRLGPAQTNPFLGAPQRGHVRGVAAPDPICRATHP